MDLLAVMGNGFDTDKPETVGEGVDIVVVTELEGIIKETGPVSQQQNIELYRGDNRTFEVTVKDDDGNAVNITGASIKFSVKERISDSGYKFQKSSAQASEITITDAANGVYEVYLVPDDTQTLDIGSYEYDSQLTTSTGKVYTVVRGEFTILAEITRPVA